MGVKIEKLTAFDLTPDAATRSDRDTRKAIELAMRWERMGQKVTQEGLAQEMGCSQSWVSKIFKRLCPEGGYKQTIKLFHSLNNLFLRKWNNSDNPMDGLSDEVRWIAETYFPALVSDLINGDELPSDLIEMVDIAREDFGADLFKLLDIDTVFDFIMGLVGQLPGDLRQLFEDILGPPPDFASG
ncbi:MAG: helix-turn-helix transcriptional regulator [Okeania sp. SIO2C9]|uniref:helix-turn-helix domain-containing protein n=1 Tax=Okeania sp. SIO2C9 TaxID=2607791 RepID=UPI0013C1AE4A|nr:helix-turn-helix transcriptional regulator [Okeania sp. SIO2C9]NEQ78319.1 helix-turn-helix transcriptional regulator [Okeania sp. SIO2C9]